MSLQNPPPHPPDDTAPDAPRISRRTTVVLGSLGGLAFTLPISRRTTNIVVVMFLGVLPATGVSLFIYLFAPWFAGLLNIHPAIVIVPFGAAGVLVLVCSPIIRRVRARSAPPAS